LVLCRWKTFLRGAGIAEEFVQEYGELFDKNRIRENMLEDLTKDILKDIGIHAVGDIIMILRHAKKVSSSPANTDKEKKKGDPQAVVIHRSKQLTITADGQTGPELVVSPWIIHFYIFCYFFS